MVQDKDKTYLQHILDEIDKVEVFLSGVDEKTFTVTLEDRADAMSPISPGLFVVHQDGMPLFTKGEVDRGEGLEKIAEDADPGPLAEAHSYTIFNTPVGDTEPGPATPGKKFEFTFTAKPGDKLSFATMFGQSNDAFYSFGDQGLELFNGNEPVTGDVTDKVSLWDAGTEVNQEPTKGEDQAPRQSGPNVGASESEVILTMAERGDGFTYGDSIRVTISAQ